LSALTGGIVCLLVFQACGSDATPVPSPTATNTLPPTQTITPLPTLTLTTAPATAATSSCSLRIRGTYNFPGQTVKVFSMGPGRYLFYDRDGGGHYGNDQAGCELNDDCTQLRAFNKDSANIKPEGIAGPWVDVQTGVSTARWGQFVVECRLADPE
jgi:hypothetical protein